MMLHRIYLLGMWCISSRAYNVEVGRIYPIYLRNGGSDVNYSTSEEPAYAGYSFHATLSDSGTSIIVGQPLAGVAGSASSVGAIYYCNVTFNSTKFLNIGSTVATTTEDLTSTRMDTSHPVAAPVSTDSTKTTFPREYLVPNCKKVEVFDPTNRYQIGDFHKFDTDSLGMNMKRIENSNNYAICTPLRQRECTGANKASSSPGACYYGNPMSETWTFMKWKESRCFDAILDVIFVVDGSQSIGDKNFKIVKRWLINAITKLVNRYGDSVRTEVLQYSDKDGIRHRVKIEKSMKFEIPFTLNQALTVAQIRDKITNMKYLNGGTYTHYALRRAMEWEFDQSIYKDESKKVVIVLTDGEAKDGPHLGNWYQTYGATGKVIPFAVGVGKYVPLQLRLIANGNEPEGNNTRVYEVASFDRLESVLTSLTSEIESSVATEGQSHSASTLSAANDTNNRQIGSSITTLKDGTILFGAVGMYSYSGGLMKFDNLTDATPEIQSFDLIKAVLPEHTKDSYLGYTSVSGYFNGNNSGEYIAAGAPRYKMKGTVVVYLPDKNNSTMKNHVTIHPPRDARDQIAAYFGGCLLSLDVSGDGYDDLFIASPLFVGENFDEGRVSVYIGKSNFSTVEWVSPTYLPIELSGDKSSSGRFGSAMAAAGDINLDGYQDVVIGAPLADGGRGVVFVYHGMSGGINQQPSQKIMSSSFPGPPAKYFGQSLQGNIDVDGNGYPDLLISAPKSDSLIVLRTRPIVSIISSVEFMNSSLDLFVCFGTNYMDCAMLKVCFYANGTSIENIIGMAYTLTLDSAVSNERVIFKSSSNNRISRVLRLSRHQQSCFVHAVNLKKAVEDFYSPIEARVDFDLTMSHTSVPLSSVLDSFINKSNTATIDWEKNCTGPVCLPNLKVTGEIILPSPINGTSADGLFSALIISKNSARKPVKLKANVTNIGENSINTHIKITHSSQVSFSLTRTVSSDPSLSECLKEDDKQQESTGDITEEIFKYNTNGAIIQTNAWITFVTENLKESASLGNFIIVVSAYSRDKSDSNVVFNVTTKTINITSVQEIGERMPDIEKDFKITSSGHSNIPTSKIMFTYPWLTAEHLPLLYLYKLECSTKVGKAQCMCDTSKINPYNLATESSSGSQINRTFSTVQVTPATTALKYGEIECPSTNHTCETFNCTITNLYQDSEVHFKASFRLWTASINYDSSLMPSIKIKSNFIVSTLGSPLFISRDHKNTTTKEQEFVITARKFVVVIEATNWQLIILCILGFILLIGAPLILWKVGFFEKNKYSKQLENIKEELDNKTKFHPTQSNGQGSDTAVTLSEN